MPELENPMQTVWMHFRESATAFTALTKGKLSEQLYAHLKNMCYVRYEIHLFISSYLIHFSSA